MFVFINVFIQCQDRSTVVLQHTVRDLAGCCLHIHILCAALAPGFFPHGYFCQLNLMEAVKTQTNYSLLHVFSGEQPLSAQPELHPSSALQGHHFQCWFSKRNLSSHTGTAGSAAAQNPTLGGWCCCHRGLGWEIWITLTGRCYLWHSGMEDHSPAF